jgi:hypothetical protein
LALLATSPFYGVSKANYSAFSSSFHDGADLRIFVDFLSLFSDRNFLGMDEKFAILWAGRQDLAAFPSPSFNLSLLLPCWRPPYRFLIPHGRQMLCHFPSEARLAIANAGEQSPYLLQANPTFPTFIDALALHLLPLHLTASVKPSTSFGFLFFPYDEPNLQLFVTFRVFSYREFPKKSRNLPQLENASTHSRQLEST